MKWTFLDFTSHKWPFFKDFILLTSMKYIPLGKSDIKSFDNLDFSFIVIFFLMNREPDF